MRARWNSVLLIHLGWSGRLSNPPARTKIRSLALRRVRIHWLKPEGGCSIDALLSIPGGAVFESRRLFNHVNIYMITSLL
jgi:hypothetical protein